tara:strand:- start:37 stop:1719 length:1683 start_codon:yes stop_codon:yes gene_type:complete
MSLLRNSVIVGGATFLVGSALMEVSKGDEKVGWWPYTATFLSGALGFYLLRQQFVPVPEALELDAEYVFAKNITIEANDEDEAYEELGYIVSNINDWDIVDIRDAEYDFQNQAITTVIADEEDEAWEKFPHVYDSLFEDWEIVDIREAEELQSFSAEVFMADRKIRRRTRWTWTRGPEEGYTDKDAVPYSEVYDYTTKQGRGYYGSYVPMYEIEDSYHISDLPEGYHLHLLKPTVRKDNWLAIAKSPLSSEWKQYSSKNKAGLTRQLLDWYNKDIATPEVKALSPIDKLKIKKGIKSGKVSIDRVVIPEVLGKKGNILTQEEVQFYASGGPDALTPIHFASYYPNETSVRKMKIFTQYSTFVKYEILSFVQGLAFMGEKVTTLRSVNRFNKNREQWVKSYPAWFQNSVKNKITYLDITFAPIESYDSKITINGVVVVQFINGRKRYSWSDSKPRKTIEVYGEELPQFQVRMSDGNFQIPRPSSQRKIYESAMNQNDEGVWEVNLYELILALVDKHKFENSIPAINEKMTVTQTPNIWRASNQSGSLISSLELMCRRFKKN